MYIFLLQSLLVETDSNFPWRTARLYQVGEYTLVLGCFLYFNCLWFWY